MKLLFLASSLVILPLIITASTSEQPSYWNGSNFTADLDSASLGQKAILGLQDFIYSMEFNLFKVGSAKTTLDAVKKIYSYQTSMAAAGYAAAFAEQYSDESVNDALTYIQGHNSWVNAYSKMFNQILSGQSSDCYKNFNTSTLKIQNAFSKLQNYSNSKWNDTNSTSKLRDAFVKECSDGSCEKAIQLLIASINGDYQLFKCDLGELMYQGKPSSNFSRGHRD
jgi:hypothetical protein